MANENIEIPIYVSTNNKHHQCLRVFVDVFSHFLPNQKLNILGYDNPEFPLPENCKFISMGIQGDVSEWSTDLRKYFSQIEDEYFIYGTEDIFFFEKPSIPFINYLANLARSSNNVGRINLVDGTEGDNCSLINSPHYRVEFLNCLEDDWGTWKLYRQKNTSNYSLTTQFSIWNKKYMLRYLIDGLSPWDFERSSAKASSDSDYDVLMIDGIIPINKKEGYSLGNWTNEESWMPFLSKEVRKEVFGDIK